MTLDGLAYTMTPHDRMPGRRGDPVWVAEQRGRPDTRVIPLWRDRCVLGSDGQPVNLTGAAGQAVVEAAAQTVLLGASWWRRWGTLCDSAETSGALRLGEPGKGQRTSHGKSESQHGSNFPPGPGSVMPQHDPHDRRQDRLADDHESGDRGDRATLKTGGERQERPRPAHRQGVGRRITQQRPDGEAG